MAELRQAIDDSMLTHTGRSIGDRASQKVLDNIWPIIARQVLVGRIEAYEDIHSKSGNGKLVRRYARSRAELLQSELARLEEEETK